MSAELALFPGSLDDWIDEENLVGAESIPL
jgi:hypothetical protein